MNPSAQASRHATQPSVSASRFLREALALYGLAVPIMGSQIASVLMGLLDTVMAGRAGAAEQAVVGLGVAVWLPIFLCLMGVVQAVSPLVAHHFGAGDRAALVHDAQQGVWLGAGLGLLPIALVPWAADLLRWFDVDGPLVGNTSLFLQGIAFGLPAALVYRALAFYSSSINRPGPSLVLGFVGLAINGVLNLGLIHGRWGLPALGGAGCGWATGMCMWLTLALMAGWIALSPHYRGQRVWLNWRGPDAMVLRKLLRLGLPIGGASLAEVAAFTGVALLIGALGPAVIAGHQGAMNFAAMIFMLPSGMAAALSIRISQALGAQDGAAARFVTATGMSLGLGLALCMAPLVAWGRWEVATIYSPDPQVQAVTAHLLLFAAAWHVADALQVCAAGALRGYRITLLPMLAMLAAYWVLALPLGAWWARHGWPAAGWSAMGVSGYWAGLLVGLFAVATVLLLLLARVVQSTARVLHPV